MKKIIYKILIGVMFLTSCSNDFVDLAPKDFLNSEDFYKTKDDFNAAVIAAYAKLQGQVGLYFELVEWRSDNLDLGAPTAGTQDRYNINKFQETSANGIIQDAWANFYNGIFRANVIIDKIGNANFDETLKKQFEGEARFLRALTYFNIVRIWGDAPIILNEISAEESLSIGRSPVSDVYATIESDLQFAMANLPSTQDLGRATVGAAKVLLGKVYLTEKKYTEAVAVLNEVVGQYTLLPHIADVFDVDNKANNEIIFSIRFNKEVEGEGHGLWFAVTDVSISPFTSKLVNAYSLNDERKGLIDYQPSGSQLVPGKFFDIQSAATRDFGNDYILLRQADVFLMLAEALNEQGYQASGDAFNFLNQVRLRAGLGAFTSVDLPDQTSFRSAVLNERFLEFPFEGHRWFDLIRTNTAKDEIGSAIGVDIQDYQLLYPVPQAEIEKINNTSLFYQNAGY
ncbi:RagB/SusD family nutrient uptake outer membrane protein [Yeosuana marina]|uniref:RagB/SusD family nutrient uptake outer membrane protein n=1 Tax=Yeosuana marina TaxID=1565536 RepID=UPI0030EE73D0